MGDSVKQMLTRLIQLAVQIVKAAREASGSFKQECAELASKTEKLAALLHQAARVGSGIYEQAARRIILETEQLLEMALSLIMKCKADGLVKRVFTIISAAAFQDACSEIESCVGNFLWLLRISAAGDGWDGEFLGLPPIAREEPILCLLWEHIATLYNGSVDDRSDAAASLISLISDNDRCGKMIIDEGGVEALLKLLKEGQLEGQKNAARAIGMLGRHQNSVDHLLNSGLCFVFEKILKEGPMTVQAVVAWAVSELAGNLPECRDAFSQNNIMRLLVEHLAFEIVHDHSKYAVVINKATSVRAVTNAAAKSKEREKEKALGLGLDYDQGLNHNDNPLLIGQQKMNQLLAKYKELEDPATKSVMKAMAARALCQLVKGNPPICRSISESRALLCFVVLLERGTYEVRHNSAMALMEITTVAQKDADLRRSVFKPNSPRCKAVIDQLLRVIEKEEDSKLLVPCIKAVGNLAATWTAGTRMSTPLVKFLDNREDEVSTEAVRSLIKLSNPENYLHIDHCKAILSAGGVQHLIQIVYFGLQDRPAAMSLLCLLSINVPDSEQLAECDIFLVMEWACGQVVFDECLGLIYGAIYKLKPYRTRRPQLEEAVAKLHP